MKLTINEYSIHPATVVAGTQGSEEIFRLSFSFGASWEGLAKKIVFVLPSGERIYRTCREDEVMIPREVMQTRGKSRCFVVGRRGKRRLVSTGCDLLVLHTEATEKEGEICPMSK